MALTALYFQVVETRALSTRGVKRMSTCHRLAVVVTRGCLLAQLGVHLLPLRQRLLRHLCSEAKRVSTGVAREFLCRAEECKRRRWRLAGKAVM